METIIHLWNLLTNSFYRNLYLELRHRPVLFRAVVNKVKKIRALTDGLKTITHDTSPTDVVIYVKIKQHICEHYESYSKQKPYWIEDEIWVNIRKEMAKYSKNVQHVEKRQRD